MNRVINTIVESYLNSPKKTDYAIMINGKWGCGKTYYIENDVKKLCKENKLKYIYISLNGCNNFKIIISKITYRLLFDINTIDVDSDLIDNVIAIGAELSNSNTKINMAFSVINKIKDIIAKPITDKLLSDIKPEKNVIIFDDLERVSDDNIRNDIIGLIYENYTKKGYKTIIVGDETSIKNEKYHKIKEKVIRRTISYEPDRKMQLNSFICNEHYNPEIKVYLDENKEIFIKHLIDLKITNLRTVSFVIDNFVYVFERISEDIQKKFGKYLFKNILILTNEYKTGNITIDNLTDKKELNHLASYHYTNAIYRQRGENQERTYINDFYDKYIANPNFSDFTLINEIFDFIITGYFNEEKLENEIKTKFYNEFIEESQKTYELLIYGWGDIEEDEFKNKLDNLIKYLLEGKYHIAKLPYLYTFLKYIQENKYLINWKYDIEKIINDSFDIVSLKSDMIPDNADLIEYHNKYDENIPNDQFYNDLINKIKKLTNKKNYQSKKNNMENTFQAIFSDNNAYYNFLYDNHTIFRDIVNAEYEKYFFKLNNAGIGIFQKYISSRILRISNIGEMAYEEKSALEEIINYIEQNLETYSQELDNFRIVRLKQLIRDMKKAVEHLENTHKG